LGYFLIVRGSLILTALVCMQDVPSPRASGSA